MLSTETINASHARSAPLDAASLQQTYLDEVYAYASRRLPTREDAEDATAETFAAAFQSLGRLGSADPRCWLFGIARRKVVDQLRKRGRRRETRLTDDIAVPGIDPTTGEDVRAFRRLVLGLPEDQREALLLQNLEGLSVAQIATVMRRSPAAVNGLLQRARAGLYRAGKDYFLDGGER